MAAKKDIKFTGERYVPEVVGLLEIEHHHRYILTQPYLEKMKVLDIACGDGYGSYYMSQYANNVVGVDIDKVTINSAKNKYINNNLSFLEGSIIDLPFEDNLFDLIVCFETIEHIKEYDKAIQQIKRVLKNEGLLIMSTPNKLEYSDKRNYKNQFHYHEFYINEYKEWVEKYFRYNEFLFQKSILGSLIFKESNNVLKNYIGHLKDFKETTENDFKFIISLSSNSPLFKSHSSLLSVTNIQDYFESYCKKSRSFIIGNIILFPLKLIKRWIKF